MRRRRWFLAGAALVLIVLPLFVAITWVSDNWELWFAPELIRAAQASEPKLRIVVGKNVQISAARSDVVHQGCTIAADASVPPRLFAASMATPSNKPAGIAGYFSHDGGVSWQLGLERTGPTRSEGCSDEALAFGADGELFLAHIRGRGERSGQALGDVELLASADGGKTWADRAVIKSGLVDRPQLAADSTPGPFRGRLYCSANILAGEHNIAAVYASADAAKIMTRAGSPSPTVLTVYNSNPVVLADGTVVVAYHKIGENAMRSARIPVWRSTDGGGSFVAVTPVRTVWRHPKEHSASGTTMYPLLAADSVSTTLAGRLYCVWVDGRFVMFSSSADRGDTWSNPILLSEQPLQLDGKGDYWAGTPAVAVNNLGQVAVLWYDRRTLPPMVALPNGASKMAGYNLRLRVSTDGGLTWLSSIRVNDAPGRGDPGDIRAWIGMAASADGRFHPAWISDSSGILQIWTAAVSLEEVP